MLDLIPAEVVSADAAALFRGLEVLTAAPDYPARLVGIFDVEHDVSVAEFQRLAFAAIDDVLAAGRSPIVVGGTGLYLRAALADLELPPPPAEGAREQWQEFYDTHGGVHAHGRLQTLDPEAAARVHPNDRRRVVRALELADAGSSLAGDALWSAETRRPTLLFGLDVPDDVLEARFGTRADWMLEHGAVAEARAALDASALSFGTQGDGARGLRGAAARRGAHGGRREQPEARALPAQVDAAHSGPRRAGRESAPAEVAAEIVAIARDRGMLDA